jgi:hypothetical protein
METAGQPSKRAVRIRPNDSSPWIQMAGPGASNVAADGQRMAMIVAWQGAMFRSSDTSPSHTSTADPTPSGAVRRACADRRRGRASRPEAGSAFSGPRSASTLRWTW